MSFDGPFNMADSCRFLPCSTDVPIIAPIWIDLDFRRFGLLYYRVSQDSATLERVRDMIVQQNPATLSAYQPTLAVIVTWFEAQPGSIMVGEIIYYMLCIYYSITVSRRRQQYVCNITPWLTPHSN